MAKIHFQPIAWDRSLSREQNYANAINTYWKVDTAHVAHGHLVSNMVCGVPVDYITNRSLRHPDIVYFYRDANDNLKVR